MIAYTYKEHGKFELADKPKPEIIDSRDAIVRVTLSSICSSDLHIKHSCVFIFNQVHQSQPQGWLCFFWGISVPEKGTSHIITICCIYSILKSSILTTLYHRIILKYT